MWSLPLLRTVRLAVNALLTVPTPRQLALGVAFGVAVGLVPKGNLIAVALGIVLCSLRLNLVVGFGTAVLATMLSPYADSLFDAIGFTVLRFGPLQSVWVWLAHQPFASWTQFHNTVVMGSLLVASAQLYPTYWLSHRLASRLLPPLAAYVKSWRIMKTWRRLEWTLRLSHAADV